MERETTWKGIKVSQFDSSSKAPDTEWSYFGLPAPVKPPQIDTTLNRDKPSSLHPIYPTHRIVSNKMVTALSHNIMWGFIFLFGFFNSVADNWYKDNLL